MTPITYTDTQARQKFCFFADPHLKQEKSCSATPPLNFLSRFLSSASFSTFASRAFLFVEKNANKNRTPFGKLAKELNPTRKTKIPAKKFALRTLTWGSCLLTILSSVESSAQSLQAIETIIKQQQNIHPPTLTPMGWIDDPLVAQLKEEYKRMKQQSTPDQQLIQQQNQQTKQMMGYTPPPTEEEKKVDYYDKLAQIRQNKTNEFFAEIHAIDNETKSIDPKKLEEIAKTKKKLRLADTNSVDYKNYLPYYNYAYNEIVKMLSGKTPLNLKKSVFLVENAYHKNKLSYEKYCNQINDFVLICKQIMQLHGLNPKNYMACHYTIQKLFSEKINFKNASGEEKIFEPFGYDFIDIFGDNDETKSFVTKLLNTKIGQCHSLPLLYLIIANELNAPAYLAIAPNHSYVKFGNPQQSYGFETTNGTFTSDEWVVASGYVTPTAIKNQFYLAPLTQEQIIAECLIDLEDGLEFLFGKSDFSVKCANTTLKYYPNSIGAVLTINNIHVAECASIANKYNFPKENEYPKYPDLKQKFDVMIDYEMKVEETGYQKIPQDQYIKWQQTANEEKQRREHDRLLGKLQQSANEK